MNGQHSHRFVIVLFLVVTCALMRECHGEFMFLGPTPYLSAADSPFAEYLGRPDFYLEDFEDGELNTPGIFQPLHEVFGTAFHGEVMGPGEFTDSVDGDDGFVDGSGRGGHSFRSGALFVGPTGIQRNEVSTEFEFNSTALGYLPNAFGFVWTDGPVGIDFFRPGLELRLSITDFEGNTFFSLFVNPTVNINRDGRTSEDFFLGVIADKPIRESRIAAIYYGDSEMMPFLEIDHVQYGRLVIPEPSTHILSAIIVGLLTIWTRGFVCRFSGCLTRV